MKLVCPKCLSSLTVPDGKMPANGGWARCPRCAGRFFVKPASAAAPGPPGHTPAEAFPARPLQRDADSQRLIDRLKKIRGGEQRADVIDDPAASVYAEITIFPEPAPSLLKYQIIGGLLLFLPLIIGSWVFFRAEPPAAVNSPVAAGELRRSFDDDYRPEQVRADLLRIRKNMFNRKSPLNVTQSGPESRVYKYFAGRLVPGVCDDISGLVLERMNDADGFSVIATCLGNRKTVMAHVVWQGRMAQVNFPGYKKWEEFEVYPLTPMTTKAKSGK